MMSCEKGPAGDVGPVGAKGATGNAGANSTAAGQQGATGATGATGAVGQKGITGPTGTDGVSNLTITDWKKVVWRYQATNGSTNVFVGEILVPEITQGVLDKGFIQLYSRINSTNTGADELPQGIIRTVSNSTGTYSFQNNGSSLGKVSIIHSSTLTSPKETIISNLNSLSIEMRTSILVSK